MEEPTIYSHVGELASNISITDDILTHLNTTQPSTRTKLNHTISILTTYAFPKISQYYSSKGEACILDKYHDEMMEYLIINNINIDKFYNSTINKSEFVSSALKYIKQKNYITENSNHYHLQKSIKKLYTILQLHQHINHEKCFSEPILDMIEEAKFNTLHDIQTAAEPTRSKLKRQTSVIQHHMVHELSRSKSQLLTLQQSNDILKEVADETQRKLIESELEVAVYKQTVNQLQQQLESEKMKISEITEKKEEILSVNRKLSHKMEELEDENQKLKELLVEFQHSKEEGNFNESEGNKGMTDVNIANSLSDSNDNESDELLQLTDNDIATLSLFYQNIAVDHEKKFHEKKVKTKKNFWVSLFGGVCVPSFD